MVLRPEGPCERAKRAERRGLLIFFPRDVSPCHVPGDHKLSLTKSIKTMRVLEASAEESVKCEFDVAWYKKGSESSGGSRLGHRVSGTWSKFPNLNENGQNSHFL